MSETHTESVDGIAGGRAGPYELRVFEDQKPDGRLGIGRISVGVPAGSQHLAAARILCWAGFTIMSGNKDFGWGIDHFANAREKASGGGPAVRLPRSPEQLARINRALSLLADKPERRNIGFGTYGATVLAEGPAALTYRVTATTRRRAVYAALGEEQRDRSVVVHAVCEPLLQELLDEDAAASVSAAKRRTKPAVDPSEIPNQIGSVSLSVEADVVRVVTPGFSEPLVNALRDVPSAKWDRETGRWSVAWRYRQQLLEKLAEGVAVMDAQRGRDALWDRHMSYYRTPNIVVPFYVRSERKAAEFITLMPKDWVSSTHLKAGADALSGLGAIVHSRGGGPSQIDVPLSVEPQAVVDALRPVQAQMEADRKRERDMRAAERNVARNARYAAAEEEERAKEDEENAAGIIRVWTFSAGRADMGLPVGSIVWVKGEPYRILDFVGKDWGNSSILWPAQTYIGDYYPLGRFLDAGDDRVWVNVMRAKVLPEAEAASLIEERRRDWAVSALRRALGDLGGVLPQWARRIPEAGASAPARAETALAWRLESFGAAGGRSGLAWEIAAEGSAVLQRLDHGWTIDICPDHTEPYHVHLATKQAAFLRQVEELMNDCVCDAPWSGYPDEMRLSGSLNAEAIESLLARARALLGTAHCTD